MKPIDWVLAVAFVGLVAYAANLLLPSMGWMIGILVALLLLYLAKRKRDNLTKNQ